MLAGVTPAEALLAGDILSTALFCAMNAGLASGAFTPRHHVYVVVGLGPVGLLTVASTVAFLKQAGVAVVTVGCPPADRSVASATVYGVDCVPARLAKAASLGAVSLDFTSNNVVDVVRCVLFVSLAAVSSVSSPVAIRLANHGNHQLTARTFL